MSETNNQRTAEISFISASRALGDSTKYRFVKENPEIPPQIDPKKL